MSFFKIIIFIIAASPFIFTLSLIIDIFTGLKMSNFFERLFKKIKRKINLLKVKKEEQMELRRSNSICYDALIFEYSEVYKFVNQIIEKNKVKEFEVVQTYLILLNKYYNEILKLRKVEKNSVEFFACVLKAIEEKPVFYNVEKGAFVSDMKEVLLDIRKYIKDNYKHIYYNGKLVTSSDKRSIYLQTVQESLSYECIFNIADQIYCIFEDILGKYDNI